MAACLLLCLLLIFGGFSLQLLSIYSPDTILNLNVSASHRSMSLSVYQFFLPFVHFVWRFSEVEKGIFWYKIPNGLEEYLLKIFTCCFSHSQNSWENSQAVLLLADSPVAQMTESTYNAGDPGSIPGSGISPGEGNGNPLQHSCLKNPMDGGACQVIVHGVAKSQT